MIGKNAFFICEGGVAGMLGEVVERNQVNAILVVVKCEHSENIER